MASFRYHGYIGAALILGGVDLGGPALYSIYPHGSVDNLPYLTMGSGSLAAIAVFEKGWREDLSVSLKYFLTKIINIAYICIVKYFYFISFKKI